MGDRVSISFQKGPQSSVVLFSHCGGREFVKAAEVYARDLREECKTQNARGLMPLHRLEPDTVMVDFIREITSDMRRVEGDLYLGATSDDGDNSDNGHYFISLDAEEKDGC